MHFTANRIEVIIEDDENLSSLCLWWGNVERVVGRRSHDVAEYGYFCICREIESPEIYCEFCEQINGFGSDTISFLFDDRRLVFRLSGNESFDNQKLFVKDEPVREIRIDLRNVTVDRREVEGCLTSIFGLRL